jgi:pimeloyl-ACP methyl ester carboxylesterase
MPQRTRVRCHDASIAVTDWGGGGPPLMLVHGLSGSQRHWDAVVAELTPQFRLVTYDQRGHGDSSRGDTYAWASLVGDLEAVIGELELNDLTLVGHSVGAGVALEVANRIGDCHALAMIDGAFTVSEPAPFRPLPMVAYRALRHRFNRGPHMSRTEVARVGDAYRSRSPQFEMSLRTLACPALYILGSQTEPGRKGADFQVAREVTALRAVQSNRHIRVQWLDAHHDMVETHPRALADALVQLHARADEGGAMMSD